MSKILFLTLSTLFTTANFALAAGYKVTQTLPGSKEIVAGESVAGGFVGYAASLWIFGISIGGVLALGSIVYAAIEWTVSAGNSSRIADAKDRITQAIIGLVLLFGAYTVLNFINPDLTQLGKINSVLSQIDNVPAAPTSTQTSAGNNLPQSHPLDTCINCVPLNTNVLPTKEAVGSIPSLNDYCNNLESPFNGDCWINQTLEEKLVDILAMNASQDENGVYKWRITEAYPPRSTHSSQCHNKFGTCVDIGLKQQFLTCDNVTSLVLVLKNTGLKVLNEYPDCAGGTTTEFSTGGHLHVYLP